jgi:hypothetical protein
LLRREGRNQSSGTQHQRIAISNDSAEPIDFELLLPLGANQQLASLGRTAEKRDGKPLYRLTVPANDVLQLDVTVTAE